MDQLDKSLCVISSHLTAATNPCSPPKKQSKIIDDGKISTSKTLIVWKSMNFDYLLSEKAKKMRDKVRVAAESIEQDVSLIPYLIILF